MLGVSPLSGGNKRSPKQSLWGNDPGLNIQMFIFSARDTAHLARPRQLSVDSRVVKITALVCACGCETGREGEYYSLKGNRQHSL